MFDIHILQEWVMINCDFKKEINALWKKITTWKSYLRTYKDDSKVLLLRTQIVFLVLQIKH